MTKNKKHHWPTLLHAFSQSNLTQKQFCQQQSINPKYFSTRRRQLLDKEAGAGDERQFVEAKIVKIIAENRKSKRTKNASRLLLCFSSGELHFDTSVSPTYIASLLRNLP